MPSLVDHDSSQVSRSFPLVAARCHDVMRQASLTPAICRRASLGRGLQSLPARRARSQGVVRRVRFSAPHQRKGRAERPRGSASVVIGKARTPVRKFRASRKGGEEPHSVLLQKCKRTGLNMLRSHSLELKQAGDFHSGDSGNASGEGLHLIREFVVHAA